MSDLPRTPAQATTAETPGRAGHMARAFLKQAQMHLQSAGGLPADLCEAFLEVPRERFLKRFKLTRGGDVISRETDADAWLGLIYSDANLGYVSAAGELLPSTASSPLVMLETLRLLDVKPGQTVVEVGSGGGYVLGLLGQLVGETGSAIGLEILDELVDQSRAALAELGSPQAEVIRTDAGAPPSLPVLDRVVINTGIWSLPAWVFENTRPGARVIAPLQTPGSGEDIAVLIREPTGFRAERLFSGSFIDSSGLLNLRSPTTMRQDDLLKLGEDLGEVFRLRTPFAMSGPGLASALFGLRTAAFQSYLAKTDPSLFLVTNAYAEYAAPRLAIDQNVCGLGIARREGRSVAVLMGGALVGYGDGEATQALLQAYREWTDRLMPGVEAFDLFITPCGGEPPEPYSWREERGGVIHYWRLAADWPRVQAVLDVCAGLGARPPQPSHDGRPGHAVERATLGRAGGGSC